MSHSSQSGWNCMEKLMLGFLEVLLALEENAGSYRNLFLGDNL